MVGQLTIQILHASGCHPIGIDLDERKVDFVRNQMKIEAFSRNNDFNDIERITSGYGVDSAIITAGTKSNDPVELASIY